MISDITKLKNLISTTNTIENGSLVVLFALKKFYETTGKLLPVVGSLPDMTSETRFYVKLKKIFEVKSKEDRKEIERLCEETIIELNKTGGDYNYLRKIIGEPHFNIIEIICKNWSQMSHFSYNKFETTIPELLELDVFEEHNKVNLIWYFLTKSAEIYNEKYGAYPEYNENKEETKKKFIEVIKNYLTGLSQDGNFDAITLEDVVSDEKFYVDEFIRNSRLFVAPCVSIVGSVASQEIIKLITYCFETINNTIIFDGINTNMSVYNMK